MSPSKTPITWLLQLALFAAAAGPATAALDAAASARAADLKQVETLSAGGSYFKAVALLDKVRAKYGDDAIDVVLASGRVCRDMGLLARAAGEYQKVLRIDPNSTEACVALSDIYRQQLDIPNAIKFARRAYESNPKAIEPHVALVSALADGGLLQESELQLKMLLKSDAKNAQVQYVAYKLAMKRGQIASAQQHLEEAIALAFGRPDWLVELSELNKMQGDYASARRNLEESLSADAFSIDALNKLAIIYEFYFHDYHHAMDEYNAILAIDPDSVTAQAGLDRCKVKKNDIAGALKFQLQTAVSNAIGFFSKPRPDQE
jgi:tetratricopeptide (TPR) repeat protein